VVFVLRHAFGTLLQKGYCLVVAFVARRTVLREIDADFCEQVRVGLAQFAVLLES